MATKVTMPQMGFDMTEGKVARWLKKVGDPVKQGEAVVEIETDKVNIESEAQGNGVLREILVVDGATVPVGAMIAIIGAPDEDLTAIKAEAGLVAARPERSAAESKGAENRPLRRSRSRGARGGPGGCACDRRRWPHQSLAAGEADCARRKASTSRNSPAPGRAGASSSATWKRPRRRSRRRRGRSLNRSWRQPRRWRSPASSARAF